MPRSELTAHLFPVVGTVATTTTAAVASLKQKARGENDRGSFAIIVFALHTRRRLRVGAEPGVKPLPLES